MAWLLRFCHNARHPDNKIVTVPITCKEILAPKKRLLLLTQKEMFADIFAHVEKEKP